MPLITTISDYLLGASIVYFGFWFWLKSTDRMIIKKIVYEEMTKDVNLEMKQFMED